MRAHIYYDDGNGLTAWIAAKIAAGTFPINQIPSYENFAEEFRTFRASKGEIHSCGLHPKLLTHIGYTGLYGQSHIFVRCARNFLNLFQLPQSNYAFTKISTNPIPRLTTRFSYLKYKYYKRIRDIFPQIQSIILSVLWEESQFVLGKEMGLDEDFSKHGLSDIHLVYHCFGSAHEAVSLDQNVFINHQGM